MLVLYIHLFCEQLIITRHVFTDQIKRSIIGKGTIVKLSTIVTIALATIVIVEYALSLGAVVVVIGNCNWM